VTNRLKQNFIKLSGDEKANVITHATGWLLTFVFSPLLILSASNAIQTLAFVVFCTGLLWMFSCSVIYHYVTGTHAKGFWQLMDHISIFILIAVSYTAFIMLYFNTPFGRNFLLVHWLIALAGIGFKLFFGTRFEWISLSFYLVLGWMVTLVFHQITATMPVTVIYLIIAGGLSYTVGVLFFIFDRKYFFHAVWHVFVIGGCASHFAALALSG